MANTEKKATLELLATMGSYGGKYINDTDEHTPATGYVYSFIQAIEETEVTAEGNITGLESITIPAGFIVAGRFTSITLGSGSVFAYQGVE